MGKQGWLVIVACVATLGSPVLAHDQSQKSSKSGRVEAKPIVLAATEGEVLLFPDGRSANLKVTGDTAGSERLMVGTESIPHGTAIPVHSHDAYEEVIFVHQGNPELTLGSRKVRAEPGTLMFIPPGTWHGVKNDGEPDSTIVFIFPEPAIADFFREVGTKPGRPHRKLTGEDWERIMNQHRMRAFED